MWSRCVLRLRESYMPNLVSKMADTRFISMWSQHRLRYTGDTTARKPSYRPISHSAYPPVEAKRTPETYNLRYGCDCGFSASRKKAFAYIFHGFYRRLDKEYCPSPLHSSAVWTPLISEKKEKERKTSQQCPLQSRPGCPLLLCRGLRIHLELRSRTHHCRPLHSQVSRRPSSRGVQYSRSLVTSSCRHAQHLYSHIIHSSYYLFVLPRDSILII